MRAFVVFLCLVPAVVLVGCATKYTGAEAAACARLAAAECAKLDACEHDGVANEYGGAAACVGRLAAACKAQVVATHSGTRTATLDACTAALAGASCADFEAGTVDDCQPHAGGLADGKACALATQCASGFCALQVHGACGTCQPFTNAGDDCSATICSPGLVCGTASTCRPAGIGGADCDDDEPCASGLTCVTPAGATTGTCVEDAASTGAPCDPRHETAADCDARLGLSCDDATSTCAPLTYAASGEPCGDVGGTTVACGGQSSCVEGRCVAFASDGAACDVVAGPACAPPALCVTSGPAVTAGACRLLDASTCG